ncbi:hypothetical protein QJQ45_017901 [Haematococcus lacustris]|nr:hypothetical protein QJQ45_017901 [Haematococcus lacustris]
MGEVAATACVAHPKIRGALMGYLNICHVSALVYGLLQGFYRSKLTRSQVQHDSGLIQAHRNTQRWNENITWHLAAATPAGTSLVAIQRHVAVTLATWDAVWGEYLHPKWAEQRMRLHGAQEKVLERYFMKLEEEAASVSQQEWGTRKQLVVFFGNAGIGTRGGWGVKAVLQACRKVVERVNSGKPTDRVTGKVVTVDEFRTSRVSLILNSPQPCEEELDNSKPTRLEGWKPKPGQVQDRLLRSAWSKRFEAPVRGLMWCPWLAQATPGDLGKWVDRDCNAALNLQRAGESKWRPLELCRWQHRGRLPAQGKEYPALGFKKLRERAPKAQAQQPPPPPTSGSGKFFYKSGATYKGDWILLFANPPPTPEVDGKKAVKKKDDPPPPPSEPPKRVRHGKGVYKEGDYVYEGDFFQDMIQGTGKFTYASGASYEGQWHQGEYHGTGRYTWPDGRTYEGQWQANKMHGQGTYTDINGHKCGVDRPVFQRLWPWPSEPAVRLCGPLGGHAMPAVSPTELPALETALATPQQSSRGGSTWGHKRPRTCLGRGAQQQLSMDQQELKGAQHQLAQDQQELQGAQHQLNLNQQELQGAECKAQQLAGVHNVVCVVPVAQLIGTLQQLAASVAHQTRGSVQRRWCLVLKDEEVEQCAEPNPDAHRLLRTISGSRAMHAMFFPADGVAPMWSETACACVRHMGSKPQQCMCHGASTLSSIPMFGRVTLASDKEEDAECLKLLHARAPHIASSYMTLTMHLLKEYARGCLGWKGKRLTQKKPLLRADILEHLRWEQEMEEDQLAEVGDDEADDM